jgi:hypothetical protein
METRIRGIPLWLLRNYLVDPGGVVQPDSAIPGSAWQGRLTRLGDMRIGSLRVGEVLFLGGRSPPRPSRGRGDGETWFLPPAPKV